MDRTLASQIEAALGVKPTNTIQLSGGCVGDVRLVELADGRFIVAKVDRASAGTLACEGAMLRHLAQRTNLPVPDVLHTEAGLLLMEFIEGESRFCDASQRHSAELLAALHAISAPRFGFEIDTLIGGLHQPNAWTESWIDFFREQRLLAMAEEASRAGRLDAALRRRVESLARRLDELIDEPEAPSLLHGDVWTTNVLAEGGRITAFLDPALHYGHAEAELAFITLFNTFGEAFFTRYNELRPIATGFFDHRRDVYNLYPLLVHVRLFGGGYSESLSQTLRRIGW